MRPWSAGRSTTSRCTTSSYSVSAGSCADTETLYPIFSLLGSVRLTNDPSCTFPIATRKSTGHAIPDSPGLINHQRLISWGGNGSFKRSRRCQAPCPSWNSTLSLERRSKRTNADGQISTDSEVMDRGGDGTPRPRRRRRSVSISRAEGSAAAAAPTRLRTPPGTATVGSSNSSSSSAPSVLPSLARCTVPGVLGTCQR